MRKYGKVFLAIIAVGLMTSMANAVSLVDYWTLDPDGTDSSTVINGIADRPTAKLKNFPGTNLGGGWSTEAATDLSYSNGSFKFDANQLFYFRLSSRDGYDGVGTDSFSISMWVKPSWLPHSANMQIFSPREWDEREPLGARISINSQSGKVRIDTTAIYTGTVDTGATVPLASSSADAPWSQLTFVFENSTIATYLNGDYVSTTQNCKVDYTTIDQYLSFGGNTQKVIDAFGYPCTEDIGYYYSGYMDDIAVWNTALLPWETKALASGIDPSTYTGTPAPSFDFGDYTEVINVNFVNDAGATAYTGSAAIVDADNIWNAPVANTTDGASVELVNVINDAGTATGISVYLDNFDSTFDYDTASTGELFRNGLYVTSAEANEWHIDGLTVGKEYDLVIYHEGKGGIDFTSGVASELLGSVTELEGMKESSKFAADEIWAEGYNYSVVTIVPTSTTVAGTFINDGSSNEWNLAGLQLALRTSEYIPGDANKDGKVDGSDVTILAGNWQVLTGADWSMGDFNGDGKVDGSDVTILAGNWQRGVDTTTASVPEPSTLVGLFILCLAGLLKFSRKIKTIA